MFRVVEAGSGTGGLTKDALPLLDAGLNAELLQYTATDITNAFSSSLQDAVKSPKLHFKVGSYVPAVSQPCAAHFLPVCEASTCKHALIHGSAPFQLQQGTLPERLKTTCNM